MTKQQREIIGPAVDLRQAMARADRQWRETCPSLATLARLARKTLLIVVNEELMHRGGEPLKDMDDVR